MECLRVYRSGCQDEATASSPTRRSLCDERYVSNVASANDTRIACAYLRLMTSHEGRGIR